MCSTLALFSLCIISSIIITTAALQFPLVDLGYATHAPTYINTTASGTRVGLYNNIRFAQPPTGALRFRKPSTPPLSQEGIQDGRDRLFSTDCVNAAPGMVPFPGLNGSAWGQEDCLFLNVWVPEGVRPGDNVPVIHWLHGSAYAFGSKDLLINAMGLMDLIQKPEDRFIFVASNYRLGSLFKQRVDSQR
jgi:carboxylesterase type B